MKKRLLLSVAALLTTIGIAAQTPTSDPGVVIDGVTWATRNVDAPGTFAETPEDAGMLYQWNRRVGWSTDDRLVNLSTWDKSMPASEQWAPANDPCPAGWRMPTSEELRKLAIGGVDREPMGTGLKITDNTTGGILYLPIVGPRYGDNGTVDKYYNSGNYWSGTLDPASGRGYFLIVDTDAGIAESGELNNANSVRCVTNLSVGERAAAVGADSGEVAPSPQPEPKPADPLVPAREAIEEVKHVVEDTTDERRPQPGEEQAQRDGEPASQQGSEDTIVGTWVSEFVPILGVTAVYTFAKDGTCTMLFINKDGFYEDFSWFAVTGGDLSTGYTWEKTEDKTIEIEGYDPIRVQTICTSKEGDTVCFGYTGGDAFEWSVYKFTRAASPDQIPLGKKKAPLPPADTRSFIVGTFEGVQTGCSWTGPTGEITNPGTVTFSADGTTDYIKVDEPIYWGIVEAGVEHTTYIREGCESEQITTRADQIRIGTKFHDGSWKNTGWSYVFEHGGFVYIDTKKYKRIK